VCGTSEAVIAATEAEKAAATVVVVAGRVVVVVDVVDGTVVVVVGPVVDVGVGKVAWPKRAGPELLHEAANRAVATSKYGDRGLMAVQRMRRVRPAVVGLAVALAAGGCAGGTSKAAETTSTSTSPATTTTTVRPPATTTSTTTAVPRATTTLARVTTRATSPCPASLPAELAYTGSARQLITVEGSSYGTTYATVEWWQKAGGCWAAAGGPLSGRIGYNGFSDHHREGDGTTPTGMYGIGPIMYGNAANPGVQEVYHHLVCGDWWDEDPSSPEYNTFQHVPCGQKPPFGGGSEALWTETNAYPSFAVVDYNTDPVVAGAGSGIFVHADIGSGTDGCVSLPLPDLDALLRWIDPADDPQIVMGPATELTRF
jgi:L,D-peptidoglycan transpeptidase YkuD (ErfK/YbiS/YcfS/YnhG family)